MIGRAALLCASALVSGCTTIGGNVKGAFSCRAPAGTCAPTATIDAKAVEHDAGAGNAVNEASRAFPLVSGTIGSLPVRSSERTITIVFPPYVDQAGVLHDQAIAHAVVEPSRWASPPANPLSFSRSPAPSSLREVVAGASASAAEGLEPSPSQAPHPVAVISSRTFIPPAREDADGRQASLAEEMSTEVPHPLAAAGEVPTADAVAAARAGHRIVREPGAAPVPLRRAGPPATPAMHPDSRAAAAEEKVRKALAPLMAKPGLEPNGENPFRPATNPGGGQ